MTVPMRRSAEGFSLIEMLVAVVVLSLGMAGALLTQTRTVEVLNGAHWRAQSGMLGAQIIERAKANPDQSYAIDALDRVPTSSSNVKDSDFILWKDQLQRSLPGVSARIVETVLSIPEADGRFLQRLDVYISWDDRRAGPVDSSAPSAELKPTLLVSGVRYKKP